MRVRIVRFTLAVPAEYYKRLATEIAPAFTSWPGAR